MTKKLKLSKTQAVLATPNNPQFSLKVFFLSAKIQPKGHVEFEEEYVFAPDPDDPTIGEGLKEACRKDEGREF